MDRMQKISALKKAANGDVSDLIDWQKNIIFNQGIPDELITACWHLITKDGSIVNRQPWLFADKEYDCQTFKNELNQNGSNLSAWTIEGLKVLGECVESIYLLQDKKELHLLDQYKTVE